MLARKRSGSIGDPPPLLELSHGREVDERNDVVGLVHEMSARERTITSGAVRILGNSVQKKASSAFRSSASSSRPPAAFMAAALDRETQRLDGNAGPQAPGRDPRRASASQTVPFSPICGSSRSMGALGRASANSRSCGSGWPASEVNSVERPGAQSLDRISIDAGHPRHCPGHSLPPRSHERCAGAGAIG